MKHLITSSEVGAYSRPVSRHIDNKRIEICISEAERLDIIPTLRDTFFYDITENQDDKKYDVLVNGGQWKDKNGLIHDIVGLKATLAYYVYARLVRIADDNVTRFGFVNKEDEYSERCALKEKIQAYTDARLVADGYLKECLCYLRHNAKDFPLFKDANIRRYGRTTYNIIGE